MGAMDVLWVFFMLSALQPILRQKMLESSRLRVLHRFEQKRKSRVIALAAGEIVMDPNAVLGPVDPQLGQSPAASVLTVLERKKPEDIDDQTLILADVSRKAIAQVRRTVQDLLAGWMGSEQAAALAEKLAKGTWTHDYPITAEEAKTLGLPVSTDMPEEVYQFLSLFPQPTRTRPAVEYIPLPYRGRSGQGQARG